jgi:hypothetical protein
MAGLLDSLSTRVSAILTGTHPSGTPYLTAGVFCAGQVSLPAQNARFPGGAAKAAANRRFDLAWSPLGFDPPGSENGAQGPWVRTATLTIRVQYEIQQPRALTPTDRELALGALEVATRRALDDAAVIQWALLRPGAFADLAIGVLLEEPATAEKVDSVRAVGTTRARFLVSQSAVTSPGLWT